MKKDTKTQKPWYKRPRTWIIAAVILLVIFIVRRASASKGTAKETATLTKESVKEELVLSGELKATQNANLQFNLSGTLAWVGVKVGDPVQKGQALMKLDTTILNATYQQSLSNLLATQANVDYVHDNLKNKDTTENFAERNTRVTAEVTHDNAYNSMLSAQKALKDATLLAPFAGVISSLSNETAGVNVTLGSPQATIVNPSTLYFSVNADQTDISHLSIGQKARLTLDAYPEEIVNATISQISFTPSTADSGTVYPVRLVLTTDNSSYKYRVGMTGDATFTLSQKDNVLAAPTKFIKSDKQGKYVYVDSNNTKKYIEVGIEGDEKTEIKTDLPEGTVIYN